MDRVIEYEKEINSLNGNDLKIFNIINKIISNWDPADIQSCTGIKIGDSEYNWTSFDCLHLIKEGKDISEYFDEEYFEINSVSYIKQEMFDGIKADLYRKIMNKHGLDPEVDNPENYFVEGVELSSGIFWVISDYKDLSDYKLLIFDIPSDPQGNHSGNLQIAPNAKNGKTYNHKLMWEEQIKNNSKHKPYNKKEYNYYPRGRVEISHNRATIYLNPNINRDEIIRDIKRAFGLTSRNISEVRISVDGSQHYKCWMDR